MFKQYILKHTIKERFTYNGTIGFSHPLQVTWINNQIICMKKGKDFNQFWVLKTKTQRATNSNTHFFKAILNLRYTLKGEAKRLGNRLIK